MKFATINGISIHYQFDDAGAAKPLIVFSNSLATDFRIWQDCVDDLSADYSILRYDKRGHGLSGMGTPPYQIDDHVNDLVALMDHLGLSGAAVVGLSVGGLIAQGLYHARPDLAKALILCDTAAKIGNADMWNDRIAIARDGGLAALVDANMQRWFSPAFHADAQPNCMDIGPCSPARHLTAILAPAWPFVMLISVIKRPILLCQRFALLVIKMVPPRQIWCAALPI